MLRSELFGLFFIHFGAHYGQVLFNCFVYYPFDFCQLLFSHFFGMRKVDSQSLLRDIAPPLVYVVAEHQLECLKQQVVCGMKAGRLF